MTAIAARTPSLVPTLAQGVAFILGTLTILLIWLGLYPAPLRDLIRTMIGGLN
jgi:NADH:ubiquinone oxidoreductase subunit 4 (subunit M)